MGIIGTIITSIIFGGFLILATIAICFFLLYFLGFSEEQRNKTNEHIIKVIERLTKEKEKSKWRY